MEPDARVERIYHPTLDTATGITTAFHEDARTRERVAQLRDAIDEVVLETRITQGISHIRPLNLRVEQATQLRAAIKNDARWIEMMDGLVRTIEPALADTPLQTRIDAISLPWWNAAVLSSVADAYDPRQGTLHADMTMTHSYISQLLRSLKIQRPTSVNAISISNILQTADGLLVLGLRAGHSYANTIMTVPAGSVEYHTGRNPLVETLYAEHLEETGLTPRQLEQPQLIGKIHDNALGQISHYVFRTRTTLTFAQMLGVWRSAIDNREHKFLIPLPDDPEQTLDFLLAHRYDRSKTDPTSSSVTTLANANTVLPPAAAALLLHHAQTEGVQWAARAQAAFGGQYVFAKDA